MFFGFGSFAWGLFAVTLGLNLVFYTAFDKVGERQKMKPLPRAIVRHVWVPAGWRWCCRAINGFT